MMNCFDTRAASTAGRLLAGVAACLVALPAMAAVSLSDAWIREVPPASPVAAAFVTLTNRGGDPVRVTAIESPLADKVHWHDMTMDAGMMRMQVRSRIVLAAGSRVSLKPGASHLMLLGLKQPLPVGAKVPLTFRFDNQPAQTVVAVVRRIDADEGAHDHHH